MPSKHNKPKSLNRITWISKGGAKVPKGNTEAPNMVAWVGLIVLLGCVITGVIWDILGDSTSLVNSLIQSSLVISFIVLIGMAVDRVRIITGRFIGEIWDTLIFASNLYMGVKASSRPTPYVDIGPLELISWVVYSVLVIMVINVANWVIFRWIKSVVVDGIITPTRTKKNLLLAPVVLSTAFSAVNKIVERPDMVVKLKKDPKTYIKPNTPTAIWGYTLLSISVLLLLAITIFNLTPDSTSTNLPVLSAAIAGSLIMIGMGKKYEYLPALKEEFFSNKRPRSR